jgi:hypothetical protein
LQSDQELKLKAIIKKISDTRKSNNLNWMKVLELAVIYAPEEALVCLKGIRDCDSSIQADFEMLVDELEKVAK